MSNQCEFEGRLTNAPEVKYLPSGTMVAVFSIADEHSFKKNNEWEKKVSFVRFESYSKLAEKIALLKKGDLVVLKARHQIDQFEKDGKKQYINKFIVNRINKIEVLRTEGGSVGESNNEYATDDIPF